MLPPNAQPPAGATSTEVCALRVEATSHVAPSVGVHHFAHGRPLESGSRCGDRGEHARATCARRMPLAETMAALRAAPGRTWASGGRTTVVKDRVVPQRALTFSSSEVARSVSPMRELGAYETLWMQPNATFKRVATIFRENGEALPSDLVPPEHAEQMATKVVTHLRDRGIRRFGVRVHRAGEYPAKLRDAAHPVELLYFQGEWDLVESRCVAVVGTRTPSKEGVQRAKQIVRNLVRDGWTIVSGLAQGIDTVAHTTALELGGRTIAVIGTPISEVYPKANADLQARIARDFLVVSQIPIERYGHQIWMQNRGFFPERNITMSALTEATIIVEAGNTSGTLIQARAALRQNRKLFILDSCFKNPELTWPHAYAAKGAIRVDTYNTIKDALGSAAN
jgi:DNA processing protein